MNYWDEILPGTRVMVFDGTLFKDDRSTPLSHTVRPAVVICRYGKDSSDIGLGKYPDLVDILFDHRPNISYGHFTNGVIKIEEV